MTLAKYKPGQCPDKYFVANVRDARRPELEMSSDASGGSGE